jgi:hypothetical protein
MEWISVKDNLPKEYESVIGYVRLNGENSFESSECFYSDGKWYSARPTIVREITHWQPLPESPKD